MNIIQKQRVEYLRRKGKSYAAVAVALGISENTVKSYCRRNKLGASIDDQNDDNGSICQNCGILISLTPGAKKKRFCSDKCRLGWWNDHPELVNKKAIYSFSCAHCGRSFESYGNNGRKYCSHACYIADRFGVKAGSQP